VSASEPTSGLPPGARALGRVLFGALAIIALLGIAADVAYFYLGLSGRVAAFFSLTAESNLPTWYASSLLFGCALLLGAIARDAFARRAPFRFHWAALTVIFVYMSLDEAVEIHEHLGDVVQGTSGVLFFGWVIPAAAIVCALGAAYVPFLKYLDRATRRRIIVAGAIYVGGALFVELPLGYWTERHGDDNFVYALIDFVEETLELAGASLFVVALWGYHGRLAREPRA